VRLLLDTHIWLWTLLQPDKLGARVRDELSSPGNERWLSPISVWELLILEKRGRIALGLNVGDWVARALEAASLKEAPLTTEVVFATREIQLPHRDPADSLLAATAKVFDLTLVTADARLLGVEGVSTLPNR